MRLPWSTPARTSGPEHEVAVSRTSADWAGEIERLSDELSAIEIQRASLIAEGGRATLDRQDARAKDVAAQIGQLDTRERIVRSAIGAAQDRQADAATAEARAHLTAQMREYASLMATWARASIAVRAAETALREAKQAQTASVDGARLSRLYDALLNAGLSPAHIEDVQGSADRLTEQAEQFACMAENFELSVEGATLAPPPASAKEKVAA